MELKDTVELMTSADWKDRFKAEQRLTENDKGRLIIDETGLRGS